MQTKKRKFELKDFDMAELAEDYLKRHNVKKLPVDVFELCRRDKIALIPYSAKEAKNIADLIDARELMDLTDGFTFQVKRIPIIIWDDSKPITRQQFTIAHELAHNLLGHTGLDGSCQFRCPNSDICGEYSNCIEWQADSLAFNLLCPDFDE